MSLPKVQQKYVRLYGGLDLSSPPIAKTPGYAVTASNVEPMLNGGYRRTLGYDRFDGHPSPSKTKGYYRLTTNGLGATTEYTLYAAVTWSGGSGLYLYRDGATLFIVSDTNPELAAGATFSVGGDSYTLESRSSSVAKKRINSIKASGYASDYRRSLISEVPGIGEIRGVVAIRDSVFAFRDQDSSNGGMFKATSSGWQAVSNNTTGFGTVLSVRDGYGIDDGDVALTKLSTALNVDAIAQMASDGLTGNVSIPVGQSCSAGDFLFSDTGISYSLTLLSAISGSATSFTCETTGNQMGGITIDPSDNAGWYVVVSGKLLKVVSYLIKTGDATKYVLTVSNPHAFSLSSDSVVEVRSFYSFCEVTSTSKITLPAGGDYKAVVHNFYGSPSMRRAYAVNGVGRALEIREDGRITPIFAVSDIYTDKPIRIEAHKEHLFLAYPGGQIQHSAIGSPLTWSGLLGAEAFAVGDEITAMKSIQGGVLCVGCRNRLVVLQGASIADWVMNIVSESVGAIADTMQSLFIPVALSNNGIVRLDRVQEYGDFSLNLLDPTEKINQIISTYTWVNSSQLARDNQYRLYSSSGINLIVSLGADGKPQFTTFRYKSPVSGCWRYDEAEERNFFALTGSGFVYELDEQATSFDGDSIRWTLKLAFMHMDNPGTIKSWRSVSFEQSAQSIFSCDLWWNIEYRSGSQFSSMKEPLDVGDIGSAIWNGANWNQFYWNSDSSDETGFMPLSGNSTSIGLALSANTNYEPNFYLSGMLINYIPRRLKRG